MPRKRELAILTGTLAACECGCVRFAIRSAWWTGRGGELKKHQHALCRTCGKRWRIVWQAPDGATVDDGVRLKEHQRRPPRRAAIGKREARPCRDCRVLRRKLAAAEKRERALRRKLATAEKRGDALARKTDLPDQLIEAIIDAETEKAGW